MLFEETGMVVSGIWAMVTKLQGVSNGERARCGGDGGGVAILWRGAVLLSPTVATRPLTPFLPYGTKLMHPRPLMGRYFTHCRIPMPQQIQTLPKSPVCISAAVSTPLIR